MKTPSIALLATCAALFIACSDSSGEGAPDLENPGGDASVDVSGGGDDTDFRIDSGVATDACTACDSDVSLDAPPAECGNGVKEPGEACDDGNTKAADGCAADCSTIETNYACPTPGVACVYLVKCGDGVVAGTETCDDGNTKSADGCDATCKIESGWVCSDPGVECLPAKCGDGIKVGPEQCDDGNTKDGDGCSALCILEDTWKCDTPGAPCDHSTCGDKKVEGTEQCDDGNHDLGDGCGVDCKKEPICTTAGCTSSCGDGILLGAETCDDGNVKDGDGCDKTCKVEAGFTCSEPTSTPPDSLLLPIVLRDFHKTFPDMELPTYTAAERNLVKTNLGADGKPVFNDARVPKADSVQSAATFDQWYRDVPGVNLPFVQSLKLDHQADGSYAFYSSAFFPLTGLGFGNEGNPTNFHFTSEVRYWFEYGGTEKLDFCGDDDVWVFLNKQLALDLGGVHGEQCGSVDVDAMAATLGMTKGKVYEIVVWQAERHTSSSNYKLTLRGFFAAKSICKSKCGDGVRTPDEVCDDGKLDSTYGGCTKDCKRADYCGDKKVTTPPEVCDDGVNTSAYGGCAPGCKKAPYCGDGKLDGAFGELCDDGKLDGSYGGCTSTCKFGPRCGDGVLQADKGEQCDDGNAINGDGCSAICTKEGPK